MPKQKQKLRSSVSRKKTEVARIKPAVARQARPHLTELLWLTGIFLLPLVFWPDAYTSFELPKVTFFRALTFLLLISMMIRLARCKTAAIPAINKLKWPLILLGLTVASWIISTILSPAPAISFFGYYPRFQGLYTWITYLIFAAVVFLGLENRRQIDRIFTVIAASSLIASVIAFAQSRGVPWLNFWDVSAFLGRFFGTMGHPDYLAGYLVMTIPLMAAMLIMRKNRLLAGAALVFSLAALYFTLSRSAYLGLFMALFIFLAVSARKFGRKKLFWATLVIPFFLAGAVLLVNINAKSGIVQNNVLLERMVMQGENLRSVQTRMVLWPATFRQIMASPFIGYGLDTYAITFPKYLPAEINTLENMGDYPDRAHNFILDYAVQFGLPGLMIFAGFILLVFISGLRFIATHKKDWLPPLALLACVAAILVTNLFGFFITVTWAYFWLMIALILNITQPKKEYAAGFLSRKYAGKIVIGAVIFLGLAGVFNQDFLLFAADMNYRTAAISGDTAAAAKASGLAPQISFYHFQEANLLLDAAFGANSENEKQLMLAKAILPLEKGGRLTAKDGFYYLYSAIVAANLHGGTAGTADPLFISATNKMPSYPTVYLEYGKYLLKTGNYGKAAKVLEQYLTLCPPYYKWKNDLGSHTPEEQERYRIFYKLNPDFDSVFSLLTEAYAKSGNMHKATDFKGYLYY